MKLDNYKIIKLIYYQEVEKGKGSNNTLKEDYMLVSFMCIEKL